VSLCILAYSLSAFSSNSASEESSHEEQSVGYDGTPMLEQLLIQQAALCWLKLNLVELGYSNTLKQSITLEFIGRRD
jgi:hypothetical protein